MSVTRLPAWNVTAIEIALDLRSDRLVDPSAWNFSVHAGPRICLVAGFALTPQLKRVVAAVDRIVPARLPREIRVVSSKTRASPSTAAGFSVQPMLALIRLQSKLARAIEPGLVDEAIATAASLSASELMDESTTRFVRDFIPSKALPTFEPYEALPEFVSTSLTTTGITVYRLGSQAEPQAILGHWTYVKSARSSVHLPSGP